jgi:hypothetical protein
MNFRIIVFSLCLCQDSGFSENVHGRVRVAEVPWYRDRIVKNISLGSLIMLLLLRLIQQNLTQVRC